MVEAINKRRSVRTFQKKALTKEDQQAIKDIIGDIQKKKGPFGNSAKLVFYESSYANDDVPVKIGTYGFVKDAPAFVAGCVHNSFEGIVDYGYLFEDVILKFTELGLGTVWLGGTFKREAFDYILGKGDIVPAITPVGYIADNQSIREKIIVGVAQSRQRMPFESLFFENDLNTPLKIKHPFSKYLELVRIGPSASNKQPWRVIVCGNKAHFYLERTPNYGVGRPFSIQALDLGIAICHFEKGLIEDQKTYAMLVDSDHPSKELEYIISFECIKGQQII
ncbi:MAG: nitroreductase [Firmicutes bacterium]|nr:nitroreductase [Bacillota bacterium]